MWRISAFQAGRRAVRTLLPSRLSGSSIGKIVASRLDEAWSQLLLKGLSGDVTLRINGATLLIPSRYIPHYVMRRYEPVTLSAFLGSLTPGMVVADVGAHVGYFTVLASRLVGATGRIHAVEPSEENLRYLRENIARNELTNVTVHPVAAGSSHRKRAFHITESSDSHGFYNHPYAKTVRTIEVEESPLGDLVIDRVDVLKIDVEGAEVEVLAGIETILSRNDELRLCVEWNPSCMKNAGRDPFDLLARMRALGFEQIDVLDDLDARRPSLDEVSALVASDSTPRFWYVNLWSRRG